VAVRPVDGGPRLPRDVALRRQGAAA
jgi:hypothetical protein